MSLHWSSSQEMTALGFARVFFWPHCILLYIALNHICLIFRDVFLTFNDLFPRWIAMYSDTFLCNSYLVGLLQFEYYFSAYFHHFSSPAAHKVLIISCSNWQYVRCRFEFLLVADLSTQHRTFIWYRVPRCPCNVWAGITPIAACSE